MASFEQTVRRLDPGKAAQDEKKHRRFTFLTVLFAFFTFLSVGGALLALASPVGLIGCIVIFVVFACLTVLSWRAREHSVLEFDYTFDGDRETLTVGRVMHHEKFQKYAVISRSTWTAFEKTDRVCGQNAVLNDTNPWYVLTYTVDGRDKYITLEPGEKLEHLIRVTLENR